MEFYPHFSRLLRACFCCFAAFAWPAFGARLVSTSPELTELLFQLGKGADILATPQYSEFPPEALKLPVLGPLFAPNLELTARLKPDWVVLDEVNLSPSYQRGLQAWQQPMLTLNLSRVENVFLESRRLLQAIYHESKNSALDRYQRCWEALPKKNLTRRYLAFVWLSPPILIGHSTYLSDLLVRLAGTNALPDYLHLPYPQVSEDWLASRAPEVVYLLSSTGTAVSEAKALFRKWWPGWQGEVIFLDGGNFSRATLTPLRHLGEFKGLTLPKECRDLP